MLRGSLISFLEWVQGIGPWGAVLFAAVYVPAAVLFVPGSLLTLGAGFVFGLAKGTVIEGFKIVLLTRLSPVFPFNLLNYAYGLTSVPFRTYVLASWIGMLPGTIMYVYLGSAANSLATLLSGETPRSAGRQILFALGLAATVAVTIIVTRRARRALDEIVSLP